MSTQVEINGKSFLPIKDAAKLVSYTRDYVARLAREGKIVATQVGRQWFIDSVSLKNFAEVSQLELSVRKQQLSMERKREQVIKQEVQAIRLEVKTKAKSMRLQAQLVAVFVLGFGLLAGAGIYTTTSLLPTQNSSLARLGAVTKESGRFSTDDVAKDLKVSGEVISDTNPASLTPETVVEDSLSVAEPQATTLFNSITEYPLFADEAEIRAMTTKDAEGVFLLARDGQIKNAEDVKGLFSDEVGVEFTAENTGVITYANGEGQVSEFPFVSVPVKEDSNQGFSEVSQ
jgi:excisionase family DNA binding protein